MKITIKREQRKTLFGLPSVSNLRDAGANKVLYVIIALVAMTFAGCNVTDPIYDSAYEVKITNDGNGTAKASVGGTDATEAGVGAEVTVTATPNTGYRFAQWTVVKGDVTLAPDATTSLATFTMPLENVEIRAEFELIPAFSITPDTDQNVAADVTSFEFAVTSNTAWECYVDGTKQDEGTGDKTVTVIFPANTTATPVDIEVKFTTVGLQPEIVYDLKITQAAAPTYAIMLTNTDGYGTAAASVGGVAATSAVAGETVTITATPTVPANYEFWRWVVISGGTDAMLSSTTANPATFTMPAGAVEIRAEFRPTVAYLNSFLSAVTISNIRRDDWKTNYEFTIPGAPAGTNVVVNYLLSGATYSVGISYEDHVLTVYHDNMTFAVGSDITVGFHIRYQDTVSTESASLILPFTGVANNDIGGVYYKEGLAQGVVFVRNTGAVGSGRIVHLYGSVNRIAWSSVSEYTGTTDTDGLANMAAVKALSPDFSNYPAFAWVDALNGPAGATTYTSGTAGTWFLPALNELGDFSGGLYKVYADYGATAFNGILTYAGGNSMLDGFNFYWTSTEFSDHNLGHGVNFSAGFSSVLSKAETMLVRPICLF